MADAVYQSSPVLVFVHIPKTAGTTFTRAVLSSKEPGRRTLAAANVFKGGGGVKRGATFEGLKRDGGSKLDGVGVLTGHFPLGIRDFLPEGRELRFVTLVREPVDRILSHYFRIRQIVERDRLEGRVRRKQRLLGLAELPKDVGLDDALAGGYIHDNLHTRMLCGDPEPFGEVTEEMLEAAKRNLREELVFFGLTERFDESLVLAKRRLGLQSIDPAFAGDGGRAIRGASRRFNATRPRGDEVPSELIRAAERCNRYDIELYRHAKQLFEGALQPRDRELESEVAALRAARANALLAVRRRKLAQISARAKTLSRHDRRLAAQIGRTRAVWRKRQRSARRLGDG